MSICLSGSLRVEGPGGTIEERRFGGRQGRLLFAMLVLERAEPVRRDALADGLWPEGLPPTWGSALRGLVSRVRSLLVEAGLPPVEAVTSALGCYQLHLPDDVRVDLEQASADVDEAEGALRADDPHAARAAALAAQSVLAHRFLPGVDGPWADERRERLRALQVRALEALVAARIRLGEATLATVAAEECLAVEPFRESTYALLMRAHLRAGNRGEALRTYDRCRRMLADELGVEPSASTQSLFTDLLRDLPVEPAGPDVAAAPDEGAPLPRPLLGAASSTLPFVGRTAALGEALTAWDATQLGDRRCVLVAGEPGIGKTRLLGQVCQALYGRGAVVLHGSCEQDATVPYAPFVEALGRYVADAPVGLLTTQVDRHGPPLCQLLPDLPLRLPQFAQGGLTGPSLRQRLFDAVVGLLANVAHGGPVLLVLDDLHEMVSATVQMLQAVLDGLAGTPVLLVAAYGPDAARANAPVAELLAGLRYEPYVTQVRLGPLSGDEIGALASGMLRMLPSPERAQIAEQVCAMSAGNPLFAGQLLRHVLESPSRARAGSIGALGVPETTIALVNARLAQLDDRARKVSRAAAVIGERFDLELLGTIVDLGEDELLEVLEGMVSRSLMVEDREHLGTYRFANRVICEALCAGMSSTQQARLHQRVGEALESRRERDGSVAGLLAHHFALADRDEGRAKAVRYAAEAGHHAMARLDFEQALHHYRWVLGQVAAPHRAPVVDLLDDEEVEVVRHAIDLARAESADS